MTEHIAVFRYLVSMLGMKSKLAHWKLSDNGWGSVVMTKLVGRRAKLLDHGQ